MLKAASDLQANRRTLKRWTHLVDELADEAVPFAVDERAVQAVLDRLDGVVEAADLGDLLEQVDAVALEAVVAEQGLVVDRLAQHHVRRFLQARNAQLGSQMTWRVVSGTHELSGDVQVPVELV